MTRGYERVNAHDQDDVAPAAETTPRATQPTPHSPPPSFRSRASSSHQDRHGTVNSDLADAFDADDDSEDETDDRQRLVRGNSTPIVPTTPLIDPASADNNQVTQATLASPGRASASPFRIYGGGIQSDGVFSNLTAKPERNGAEKEEQPPTYEQAAADAAPPYWETTILAPGLAGFDEVYIDGMPVGSVFSFIWNGMISMSFQLVGFLLTYLLHSTHAAKNGSRAGLGITLIQYGFYMKSSDSAGVSGMGTNVGSDGYTDPPDPNAHEFDPGNVGQDGRGGNSRSEMAGSEWAAYTLMVVGWFILIRAVSDYLKARRHEQLVLQSPDRGLGLPIIAEGEAVETVV